MIELLTLGAIELCGTVQGEPYALLRQPKRMALLAYLALARPRGLHHRDTLLALFWPELDTAHARGTLSQALHVLRRTLGRDVVVTRGPELVGLDPQRLWCDATAFEAALQGRRLHDALEVYGGELLPGLAVPDAPEFDRWQEKERERLAHLHVGLLERLAREAEARADPLAAVELWRRLLAHDPYNSGAALSLTRVLAAAGERPEALRFARSHMQRLRAELEVEPDPEIVRFADALRAGRAETPSGGGVSGEAYVGPAGAVAEAPDKRVVTTAPRLTAGLLFRRNRSLGRVTAITGIGFVAIAALWSVSRLRQASPGEAATVRIAVLPFTPTDSGPDHAYLADGLAEEVLTTLAHVPGLEVIAQASTFRLRGEPNAREVGHQLGVDVVLDGSVERCDGQVCVTGRLTDARNGRTRWSGRYERPVGNIVAIREEISLAVAEELRVRLAPYRPNRYTESVRAYDRFLQGVYAHRRGTTEDLWKALQFYREAYEEDPSFALAHAIAAMAYMQLAGNAAPRNVAYREARKHATLAVELDTLLAEGWAALGVIALHHDWDFVAAERFLRHARMIYPSLPQAHSQYGWYLLQVRGRPEEAVASIRRAYELDPLNAGRSLSVESALYLARRYDEVLEQHRTTLALDPAFPPDADEWPVAGAYREKGMYAEAVAEYVGVQGRNGGVPLAGLAVAYARMGRTSEARRVLRELEERSRGGAHIPALAIGRIYAALGDADGAFEWLERAYQTRSAGVLTLGVEPTFDTLRGDTRFADLLWRIGLSPTFGVKP